VKPFIFPTSQNSNPLVILVFVKSQHFTYGKSLRKFYTSYSLQFQHILWITISTKVVFYHTSHWKIVFSYVCLGRTLLFEFIPSLSSLCIILSKFYANFPFFSLQSLDITRFKRLYVAALLFQDHSPLSISLFSSLVLTYSLPAGIIGGFTVLSFGLNTGATT